MNDLPRERTITLVQPVEYQGGQITELKLRPPKMGEWLKAAQARSSLDQLISIVSLVAGVPREALERMDADQVMEAGDFITGFIRPSGQETG